MAKTKQVKNIISAGGIAGFGLLISIFMYIVGELLFAQTAGFEGVRILSVVFETLMFISLLGSFSVPEAMATPLSRLFSKKQLKQAEHLLKISNIYCLAIGVLSGAFICINAEKLAIVTFHNRLCVIPFQITGIVLMVMGISACFKTYFSGYGVAMAGAICNIIESACFLIFGTIFSKIGFSYGKNIGSLLKDDNFASCYAASGLLIAFGIGQIISLLFLVGLYFFSRKYLKMMVGAGSKIHKVSKERMSSTFIANMLSVILSMLMFRGFLFIIQLIFTDVNYEQMSNIEISLALTQTYGRILLFFAIPFYLLRVIFCKTPTHVRAFLHKSDFSGMRKRHKGLLHAAFMYVAPMIIWVGFGGAVLEKLFFPKHTIESTGIIMMFAGISLLFLAFGYMLHRISLGFDRGILFQGIEIIIFLGFIGCNFLFVKVLDLGLLGCIYALLLYSLVLVFTLIFLLERCGFSLRTSIIQFAPIFGGCAALGILQLAMSNLVLPNAGAILTLVISLVICIPIYWTIIFLLHGTTERELMTIPGGKLLAYVGTMMGLL